MYVISQLLCNELINKLRISMHLCKIAKFEFEFCRQKFIKLYTAHYDI